MTKENGIFEIAAEEVEKCLYSVVDSYGVQHISKGDGKLFFMTINGNVINCNLNSDFKPFLEIAKNENIKELKRMLAEKWIAEIEQERANQ